MRTDGYPTDPAEEISAYVADWLESHVLRAMPDVVNVSWLAEDLTRRLGKIQGVAAALEAAARQTGRDQRISSMRLHTQSTTPPAGAG